MFSKIRGFKVFNKDFNTCISYILEKAKTGKVHVVSGNPEVLTFGEKDKLLNDEFKKDTTVIIPDGIGVVIASKFAGEPVSEKIAGIEVVEKLLSIYEKENKGIFLLGAKEEVIVDTYKSIQVKYPKLNITGYNNGYFDIDNCDELIDRINEGNPEAIFVAMGCPRQEKFIRKYFDKLNCKVFMGIGGAFDVISGKSNRAPRWMINCGLEWLYRVIKEPFRIKRLAVIPKYILKVIFNNKGEK